MKAVILAGGLGSRIAEETESKPKPMVEIGGKPILWHIMKTYSSYGVNEFIICCGYKGYVIKEYFKNYFIHMSDITFSMNNNQMEVHNNSRTTEMTNGVYTMQNPQDRVPRPRASNDSTSMTQSNLNSQYVVNSQMGAEVVASFNSGDTNQHAYAAA